MKFNPSDPLPHLGVDQLAVFAKCGHDPSVAGKLIFAPGAKAAPPKGFDKLALTSLSDLPVASIEPLTDEAALARAFAAQAARITPFALCEAAECVIFVECANDPSVGAGFFYLEQRAAAVAGYSVPYRLLPALADALLAASSSRLDLSKCVWLHSTGRCGSTLLCKVLAAMGGIQSLNEPDVYSHLPQGSHRTTEASERAAALRPVARACTLLLLHAQRLRHPDQEVIFVKTRAHVVRCHALLREALPEMRGVFLYRNAVDFADSACMAFLQQPVMVFLRARRLDGEYVFGPRMQEACGRLTDPSTAARCNAVVAAHRDVALRLGAVGLMLHGWMHNMGTAEALLASGDLACSLRYEDLVERKQALAQQMLHALGLQGPGPDGVTAAATTGRGGAAATMADDPPDEDAVVPSKQLQKARRESRAERQRVDEAFATQAHQGGNAQLAGRRGRKARGADGRLLPAEPLYFPPEEVPELRRFMALHDFLGTVDPYGELPKTLA